MHEKIKMAQQTDENLVHEQQQCGIYFGKFFSYLDYSSWYILLISKSCLTVKKTNLVFYAIDFLHFSLKTETWTFSVSKKSVKRTMFAAFAGLCNFIRSGDTPLWNWLVRNPYLPSWEKGRPPSSKCWCKLSYLLIGLSYNAAKKLKMKLLQRGITKT